MSQKYNKTENPKGSSGHSVPLQDRHNASSRPRLFFRLGCAALALMLAVGGVSLLRSSFEAQLPMVHAATGATISEAAGQTWEANVNMSPGDTSIQVCKIFLLSTSSSTTDNGGKMVINSGKTVEMVIDDGYNDASVIEILSGATLHLYGTMTGNFDELKIANKEAEATSRDGHFYIHLYEGAIFKPTYNSDNYIEPVLGV